MQWFNTPWEQEINSTSLTLMEWRQVNDALSEQCKNVVNYSVLNPLMTLMSFRYPPWKHKKIRCFLMISGVWKETSSMKWFEQYHNKISSHVNLIFKSISCHFSFSIPPENIGKPLVFKETSNTNWVQALQGGEKKLGS